ncbi:sensor domain-containing protein [Streptomyces sp. AP-93]|uniref:sensor histidine kinase n=1 Tax=Streptomyces sp. AP-93 TaxID=2929048 RepID=UPI001FAFC624|nr:sensor domain-containing protein [Streptomyces sp. AP-93]MCJ0871776.1 sensor domain-containing protein [Streptomyces sp. AP-93]
MRSRNVWQALPQPGYLLSPWPWRSAAYLLSSAPVGAAALVTMAVLVVVGGVLAVVLVGLPVLAGFVLVGVPLAAVERRRLRLVDEEPAPDPHRAPGRRGVWAWTATRFREQATWRELAYALVFSVVLWPLELLAVALAVTVPLGMILSPLLLATVGRGTEYHVLKVWSVTSYPQAAAFSLAGLLAAVACGYGVGVLAGARGALTRLLIAPKEAELGAEIVELTRSRVRLVDAFEAERRRIERDLHDGAQQRLVALSMTLGLAKLDVPPGPGADLVAKAHEQAGQVLAELRELIHGIHPQVLADHGLEAAVNDAADRSVIPVDVDVELPERPAEAVEAAAYFVVCEALANVAKHSGATRARVSGGHRGDLLVMEIQDDGRGGARADAGTGLLGLADRVSVLHGRLALSSPSGGPTLLRVEIPWAGEAPA